MIKEAEKNNKIIGVVAQKDSKVELPKEDDLNRIGTVAQILKVLKMPDGNITAVIQGRKRFEIQEIISTDPYYKAKIKDYTELKPYSDKEFDALVSSIKDISLKIIDESPNIPNEASIAI